MRPLSEDELLALMLAYGAPVFSPIAKFRETVSRLFPRLPRSEISPRFISVSMTLEIHRQYAEWYQGNGGAGSHSSPAKRGHTDH
jgi:hypothetical protein